MAETNDNWEYLGSVNLFLEDDKQFKYKFFLYMKVIGSRPFYRIKKQEEKSCYCLETTVSKCMDNSRYNAFADINLERFGWNVSYSEKCYRCYLNVPTWDRME